MLSRLTVRLKDREEDRIDILAFDLNLSFQNIQRTEEHVFTETKVDDNISNGMNSAVDLPRHFESYPVIIGGLF